MGLGGSPQFGLPHWGVRLALGSLVIGWLASCSGLHIVTDRSPAQVNTPAGYRLEEAPHTLSYYLRDAWKIAVRGLKRNIITVPNADDPTQDYRLIAAGAHQFRTLWARDFAFSSGGALFIGERDAVRDSLEVLFKYQREDGLLPRVVDSENLAFRFLGGMLFGDGNIRERLIPGYETEHGVIAIDGNVLIVWKASEYLSRTGDRRFAEKWFSAAQRSIEYLEKNHLSGGLLGKQEGFGDWADSVARKGRVSFTNGLYILALRGLANWSGFLGRSAEQRAYQGQADAALARFRAAFLVQVPATYVRNFEQDFRLSSDANLLAVAYGLLSLEESRAVMETMRASPLWKPIPGRATFPNYDWEEKHGNVKLAGIEGYHDEFYWIWLTALAALAERRVGNCAEYERIMGLVSFQIAQDQEIYEIYERRSDGKIAPVDRAFYLPEYPFSWSAGMYLESRSLGCSL